MHEAFRAFADTLHPSFERLVSMSPVSISTIPREVGECGIYLFSEGDLHLYVGRTRKFRQRMRNHSLPSSQHNQAVFAFRLARGATGKLEAAYSGEGRRRELVNDQSFATAFANAKSRIRQMDLRFVEESDPLRQALLEIYVSVVLKTPYNDFNTH